MEMQLLGSAIRNRARLPRFYGGSPGPRSWFSMSNELLLRLASRWDVDLSKILSSPYILQFC